jgi:hypothetical protein
LKATWSSLVSVPAGGASQNTGWPSGPARRRLLRYFGLGKDLVRVGFLAQSPTGQGCAATFDHITFRPGAPENLRDGS